MTPSEARRLSADHQTRDSPVVVSRNMYLRILSFVTSIATYLFSILLYFIPRFWPEVFANWTLEHDAHVQTSQKASVEQAEPSLKAQTLKLALACQFREIMYRMLIRRSGIMRLRKEMWLTKRFVSSISVWGASCSYANMGYTEHTHVKPGIYVSWLCRRV